jgi:hypothetical protein
MDDKVRKQAELEQLAQLLGISSPFSPRILRRMDFLADDGHDVFIVCKEAGYSLMLPGCPDPCTGQPFRVEWVAFSIGDKSIDL